MRRLKRVVLENFQSHRYTEIVFAPTLTVLIGESDQGKSAVVRALRWLFYNKPHGADFMRAGSDYCRVAAEFDDGVVVFRERRGKVNRYEIRRPGLEPYPLEGFGREVPSEIEELTEVQALKLEGAVFELHVSHQLDPPFLLRETPAVRARAVGHLSGTHLFDAAGKRAGRKIAVLSRARSELDEKLAALEVEIQGFEDLPEVEEKYRRCADFFQKSRDAQNAADSLNALKERYGRVTGELAQKDGLIRLIPDPRELQAGCETVLRNALLFEKIKDLYEKREKFREGLLRVNEVISQTARMKETEKAAGEVENSTEQIHVLKAKSDQLIGRQREQRRISEMLGHLQAVLRAEEVADLFVERAATSGLLKDRHARWTECSTRLRRVEAVLTGLRGVAEAEASRERGTEDARRLTTLTELQRRRLTIRKDLSSESEKSGKARTEVERLASELRRVLLEARRCPVCHTPLNSEQVESILRNELGEEN
ncbi:MAG: AAA family ATPase [Bacillota bacterium]